jgi:hypothetical protein
MKDEYSKMNRPHSGSMLSNVGANDTVVSDSGIGENLLTVPSDSQK